MQVREILLEKGQGRGMEQVAEDLLPLLQRAWCQLSKGGSLTRVYCQTPRVVGL